MCSTTIRLARERDAPLLRRLAELDSAAPLGGQVLLVLAEDGPVAAISLEDQRVVANPFRPTAEAVAELRRRSREHLSALGAAAALREPGIRRWARTTG